MFKVLKVLNQYYSVNVTKFSWRVGDCITVPFNNMQTLKFKAQPSIKCSASPPSFQLLASTVSLSELCSVI